MIIQDIYLEQYDWFIRTYYSATPDDSNAIIADIVELGCKDKELKDIFYFLKRMSINTGFTYSSDYDRSSVVVISETTDGMEFQDTFDHEKGHLAMHICQTDHIDPFSEDYQYLVGTIGRKMYPIAKLFLCDNCRRG